MAGKALKLNPILNKELRLGSRSIKIPMFVMGYDIVLSLIAVVSMFVIQANSRYDSNAFSQYWMDTICHHLDHCTDPDSRNDLRRTGTADVGYYADNPEETAIHCMGEDAFGNLKLYDLHYIQYSDHGDCIYSWGTELVCAAWLYRDDDRSSALCRCSRNVLLCNLPENDRFCCHDLPDLLCITGSSVYSFLPDIWNQ